MERAAIRLIEGVVNAASAVLMFAWALWLGLYVLGLSEVVSTGAAVVFALTPWPPWDENRATGGL